MNNLPTDFASLSPTSYFNNSNLIQMPNYFNGLIFEYITQVSPSDYENYFKFESYIEFQK